MEEIVQGDRDRGCGCRSGQLGRRRRRRRPAPGRRARRGVDAFTLPEHDGEWRIVSIAFAATGGDAAGGEGGDGVEGAQKKGTDMSDASSMTPGTIGWRDLTVDDAETVRDFYARVVGWRSQPVHMGDYNDFSMLVPSTGETVAGVCHARGVNAGLPAQWLIYVVVENVEVAARTCADLGGEVVVAVRPLGEGRFCVIRDPAGAVCALYQP